MLIYLIQIFCNYVKIFLNIFLVINDPWSPALDNANNGLLNSNLFATSQDNLSGKKIFLLSSKN